MSAAGASRPEVAASFTAWATESPPLAKPEVAPSSLGLRTIVARWLLGSMDRMKRVDWSTHRFTVGWFQLSAFCTSSQNTKERPPSRRSHTASMEATFPRFSASVFIFLASLTPP